MSGADGCRHPRSKLAMTRTRLWLMLTLVVLTAGATLPSALPSEAAIVHRDQIAFRSGTVWTIPRAGQADYTFVIDPSCGEIRGWYLGDWSGDGHDTPAVLYGCGSSVVFGWMSTLPANGATVRPDQAVTTSNGNCCNRSSMFGDWNGDGIDTHGLDAASDSEFLGSGDFFFPRAAFPSGQSSEFYRFWFGIGAEAGDIALHGDWDGDGADTLAVYRSSESKVYYTNTNPTVFGGVASTDGEFWFGARGDVPYAGDWDGDGKDSIGVYRRYDNTFYFRNSLATGPGSTMPARLHDSINDAMYVGRFGLP